MAVTLSSDPVSTLVQRLGSTVAVSSESDALINAMTVDVEDYFQVSAFDAVVPRSSWGSREIRVRQNTERLLDLFAGANVKATFFVLGWVAERFPGLVRRIVGAG